MGEQPGANERWAEMLSRWAIPDDLVAAAPESPYFFDPQVFIDAADEAITRVYDTPSDAIAREALPIGGTVLDVACGAGAASVRLDPERVTGVDPNERLLEAFATRAQSVGLKATTIKGTWPDTAAEAPAADVVVCHHVVYNVPDLATFAVALGEHARDRVVVELTAVHPMAWMAPYWQAMHGLEQPDRPVLEDAIAVLEELGVQIQTQRWRRHYPMIGETGDQALQRIARRLCLQQARYEELRRVLTHTPPPRESEVVTLWW
jgi:SAM-dependent methyltransferase